MSLTSDLATALARALSPVERALGSKAAMSALLADFGWLVGTQPPETGHQHDHHAFPPPRDFTLSDQQMSAAVAAFGVTDTLRAVMNLAERLARGEDVGQQALDTARSMFALLGRLNGNGAGLEPFDNGQLWSQLAQELPDYLLITYLESYHLPWLATLDLLGMVQTTAVNPTGGRIPYQRRRLLWDKLDDLVSDPLGHLGATYGWGTATFDHQRLLLAL